MEFQQIKQLAGIAQICGVALLTAYCSSGEVETDPMFRSELESVAAADLLPSISAKAQGIGVTGAAITVLDGENEPITYHLGRSKPNLQFQAASMSKAIAAAVILTLAEQEAVGLDDDIREQIVSLKSSQILPLDRAVTLRQLLSNTSGASVEGFWGYAIGDELPTTQEIVTDPPAWHESAVDFDGEVGVFSYAGGGFMVAQLWAEDISGKDFADLAQRLLLDPLGMKNSTFVQTSAASDAQKAARVGADGDGLENSWRNHPEQAAAGLWTTSEDYAKFAMALVNAANGEQNAISSAIAKAMTTSQVQLEGKAHYGLATQLYLNDDRSVRYVSHSGGNAGYKCLFSASPPIAGRQPRVVVSMTNAPQGAGFNQDVVYGLMAREISFSTPNEQ
ncbi:MAG: serine hydrolase domain-containing protein [Pseudomonadota bacterium]